MEISNILNWPLAVLIFSLVFALIFRKAIERFIDRVKSVSRDGVSTDSITNDQIQQSKTQVVEDFMRQGDSVLLKEVESAIKANLEEKGLDASSDTAKVLIHHLAATQIALEFEQVYSMIFGSQLYLLKNLNELKGSGLDSDSIQKHYENVKTHFSDSFPSWSVGQYMNFLTSRFLVRQELDRYHITVRGAEFLLWIVRESRRENKPL
jgi:hypothetical protein